MRYMFFAAGALWVAGLFYSCKKKSDPQPQTCPLTVASIAGTYRLTSQKLRPSGGVDSEIFNTLPACQKDNLLVLNSNGNFSNQDAGVVCVPPLNYSGSWTVNGSALTLETLNFTITSFNCTNLVCYQNNFPAAGDRTTFTYTKQ